jgi:hypothetical protein
MCSEQGLGRDGGQQSDEAEEGRRATKEAEAEQKAQLGQLRLENRVLKNCAASRYFASTLVPAL